MMFICFDLDETVFSADINIAPLKQNGYMSATQLQALDPTEYLSSIEIMTPKKEKQQCRGSKVQFYHIKKHLTLFRKAAEVNGRNFSLFFLTNGLYSRNSINLILRQAASVNAIEPPNILFPLYNRNNLFGNSDGSPDPAKVAHEKVRQLIAHKATLLSKFNNRQEQHIFYFIDDNETNRQLMQQRIKAITIDPKAADYPQRLDELIQLIDSEIQRVAIMEKETLI